MDETKGRGYCDELLVTAWKVLTECYHNCHSCRYRSDMFLVIGEEEPEKDFSEDCDRAEKLLEKADIRFFAGYVFGKPEGITDLRDMIALAEDMLQETERKDFSTS